MTPTFNGSTSSTATARSAKPSSGVIAWRTPSTTKKPSAAIPSRPVVIATSTTMSWASAK